MVGRMNSLQTPLSEASGPLQGRRTAWPGGGAHRSIVCEQ